MEERGKRKEEGTKTIKKSNHTDWLAKALALNLSLLLVLSSSSRIVRPQCSFSRPHLCPAVFVRHREPSSIHLYRLSLVLHPQ